MTTPKPSSLEFETVTKAIHVSRQLLALLHHKERWDDGRMSALTIRLPRPLLLSVRQQAIERGVSISEVVRTALT